MRLLTGFILTFLSIQTFANGQEHKTLALEYIELSNLKYSFTQPFDEFEFEGVSDAEMKHITDTFEQALSWEKAQQYALQQVMKTYSKEQLIQINTLFKTPAGKLLTQNHPVIEEQIREFYVPILLESMQGN